jgi:hypothetical protein
MLRTRNKGNVYLRWPIRLVIARESNKPFTWHAYHLRYERGWTGEGCMPGVHRVSAQVLHFWRLRVIFGNRKLPWVQRSKPYAGKSTEPVNKV